MGSPCLSGLNISDHAFLCIAFLFFCKTDLLSVIICYLQVWPLLPAPVFGCLPPGQAAMYTNTHTAIISDYRLSWLKTSVAPGQDKLSVCTHVVFAQPAGRRSESTKGKRCAKYSHDPARLRHRSPVTSGNAAPHGKVHQPCKCKVHQPCECKAGSLTTYVHGQVTAISQPHRFMPKTEEVQMGKQRRHWKLEFTEVYLYTHIQFRYMARHGAENGQTPDSEFTARNI